MWKKGNPESILHVSIEETFEKLVLCFSNTYCCALWSGFYLKPTGFGKVGEQNNILHFDKYDTSTFIFWIDGNCL